MTSVKLQAFHNDESIKQKYISRVQAHRLADNIIQGTGWEEGKGCAVGCTLENYNHKAYETELGIPEWLARVEDCIFEGLTKEEAVLWPEKFLSAIRPGTDLDRIKSPFLIFNLQSSLENFDHTKYPDVVRAIDTCIKLHETNCEDEEKWSAAKSAAWSAAESAAWSAAKSAAESAAWSAAKSAAYSSFANKLIELMQNLK